VTNFSQTHVILLVKVCFKPFERQFVGRISDCMYKQEIKIKAVETHNCIRKT